MDRDDPPWIRRPTQTVAKSETSVERQGGEKRGVGRGMVSKNGSERGDKVRKGVGQDSTICHRVCERLPGSLKLRLLDEAEQKLPGLIYVRT